MFVIGPSLVVAGRLVNWRWLVAVLPESDSVALCSHSSPRPSKCPPPRTWAPVTWRRAWAAARAPRTPSGRTRTRGAMAWVSLFALCARWLLRPHFSTVQFLSWSDLRPWENMGCSTSCTGGRVLSAKPAQRVFPNLDSFPFFCFAEYPELHCNKGTVQTTLSLLSWCNFHSPLFISQKKTE